MRNLRNVMMISVLLVLSVAVVAADMPDVSADTKLTIDTADYSDGLLTFSGNAKTGKVVTLWITQDGQKVSPYMDVQPDAEGRFSKKVQVTLNEGKCTLNAQQFGILTNKDICRGLQIDSAEYRAGLLTVSGNAVPGGVVTMWLSQSGQKVSPYMDVQPGADGGFSKKVRMNLDNGSYVLNAQQSNNTVTINVTVGIYLDYAGFDGTVLRFCGAAEPGMVVSSWVEDSNGKRVSSIMDTTADGKGKFFSSVNVNLTGEGLSMHSKQSGVECVYVIEKTEVPKPVLDRTHVDLDALTSAVISVSSCLGDNAEYVWSSSSQKICAVDENGTVRAVSAGAADISVKMIFGSETIGFATCTAAVSYLPLKIDTGAGSFVEGSSMDVSVVVPAGMSAVEIVWTSSDPALKISGNGSDAVLASTKPGNYTVSVIAGGLYKAEFSVIVTKTSHDPEGGSGIGPETDPSQPDEPAVEEHKNPDGSVTKITTSKKTDADGNDIIIKNEITDRSGTVTEVVYETVTDSEGTEVENSVTTTITDPSGNTTTDTSCTSKLADGSVVKTQARSEIDSKGNGKTESTVIVSDGKGKETVKETLLEKTDRGTKEVVVEKTVSDGDVTETNSTVVSDADGNPVSTETSGKTTHLDKVSGNTVVVEFKKSVDADGKVERTDEISVESESRNMKTHSVIGAGHGSSSEPALVTEFECGDRIDGDVIDDVLVQHALAFSSGLPSDVGRSISAHMSDSTSAEFTSDAIRKILGCGAELRIEGGDGSLAMGGDIVSTLAGDGSATVRLSLKANDTESLNDKQRQVVGDRHFVELNAFSGNRGIHELGGKATVTFGYSLGTGESPEDLCVYHVDEDGVKTAVDSVYRDGGFTMVLDHFSIFMVDSIHAESGVPEETNDYGILPAAVILAVAVVAIAAVVRIRRN